VFRHLQDMTWSFVVDGQLIHAIYVYSEPCDTDEGTIYVPRAAAESGVEGLACVDDVARAAVLALRAYDEYREPPLADLARQWLSFVRYMQLADGRFVNFVLDGGGQRNLTGATSHPGGAWWTARALWALATAYRVLGDTTALEALSRCPLPDPAGLGDLKISAVLTLAGIEVLRSDAPANVRTQWEDHIVRWCDSMAAAAANRPSVPDTLGSSVVALWGYHQLHALASATTYLGTTAYLPTAAATVVGLVRPVLSGNFYYAYPGDKANQCAYCVSPLVQGLAQLYRATGDNDYRLLALDASEWFYGTNDAGAVMYDPASGRCFDGLTGTQVSRNCGAESAIEAGFAELDRHQLDHPSTTPRSTLVVS